MAVFGPIRGKTVFITNFVGAAPHNHVGIVDARGDGATSVDGQPPHRHLILDGRVHTAADHDHQKLSYDEVMALEAERKSA